MVVVLHQEAHQAQMKTRRALESKDKSLNFTQTRRFLIIFNNKTAPFLLLSFVSARCSREMLRKIHTGAIVEEQVQEC